MLRVHQRGILGRIPKEGGVKHFDVGQDRRSFYIIRVRNQGRINTAATSC